MIGTFEGMQVVVTGGAGALGTAVVGELVEAGAICLVPDRRLSAPKSWAFADHPQVRLSLGVDLSDEASVEAFYGRLLHLWASIHCAGGFEASAFADTRAESFRRMMAINAETAFLCSREAVKAIRRRADGQGGRIVNVAARQALEPRHGAGAVAYTASKGAVAAFSAALAEEVAGDRIFVNAVAPAILDTPANRAGFADGGGKRSWVTPEEAADVICWLASPANSAARGGVIPLYGRDH